MALIQFREPGDGGRVVSINPDHVQSVTSSDWDNVKATRIVLVTGEEWIVEGDLSR